MSVINTSAPTVDASTGVVRSEARRTNVLGRFARDKRGSTAIIFGLTIYPIFLTIGLAVDYGRAVGARNQMQQILDSAALAGGRAAQTFDASNSEYASAKDAAIGEATKYFNQMGVSQTVSKSIALTSHNSSQTEFEFTATAWVQTPFLNAAGIIKSEPALPGAPQGCEASWWNCQRVTSKATALVEAGGSNDGTSLEVSMMLDITGSMSGSKITDLKAAAKDAVDIMVWADQSQTTSRIALVPFSEDVRLPTLSSFQQAVGTANVSTGTTTPALKRVDQHGYWFNQPNGHYCVVERPGADRYTDKSPTSGGFVLPNRIYSAWSQTCAVPTSAALMPLTSNKTQLKDRIDALTIGGGTAGHIGTAWAWYTLSPDWKDLWAAEENKPKAYGTEKLRKIAILMTDGDYNTQYSAKGIKTSVFSTPLTSVNGSSNTQALALCEGMKAKNIEVFTIGFMVSSSAETMLKTCATDHAHYYSAANGEALRMAFRDIALKISKLRLSQ